MRESRLINETQEHRTLYHCITEHRLVSGIKREHVTSQIPQEIINRNTCTDAKARKHLYYVPHGIIQYGVHEVI